MDPIPATTDDDDKNHYSAKIAPGETALAFIAAVRNATTLDYTLRDAKARST